MFKDTSIGVNDFKEFCEIEFERTQSANGVSNIILKALNDSGVLTDIIRITGGGNLYVYNLPTDSGGESSKPLRITDSNRVFEASDKINESNSLASFPTSSTGEISGLSIAIPSDGDYLVSFKCNVTLIELGGNDPYLEIGIYDGSTKIDTLKTSSTTTDGNSTIRTMLCSSFPKSLTGGQNLRFLIDSVSASPTVSDVKVSLIELD